MGSIDSHQGNKTPFHKEESKIWTERGSKDYLVTSFALFLVGFITFSLLYCVQPILPELTRYFHVSVTESSFAISLTTGFLAVSIFCSGATAESLGRKGIMFFSMASASFMNIFAAFLPSWNVFLIARACEGFVLGGVPAVAMAYLSEEIHPKNLGYAMGIYVGGTAFGGMFGRVAVGIMTEFTSWQMALRILGTVDLLAAIIFGLCLPTSKNFIKRTRFDVKYHAKAWSQHITRPDMFLLFGIGGLAVGSFITIFNFIDFRLVLPPFSLSSSQISFIFLSYISGMMASPAAGSWSDRIGRGPVLIAGIAIMLSGMWLTLSNHLLLMVCGILIFTTGFFTIHSVASGWVGQLARQNKGHATSLYLLCYYMGSSIFGSLGGVFWTSGGWPRLIAYTSCLLAIATIFSTILIRRHALSIK
ncbi:MFS transporter [Zymomonas mobilis]|uniref:MFS transporter n=1 Tax=Zymomonas mobilis TaxID=542 RepID=UPI0003C750D7|nr:MFS transporter [Zymomonas mobilis]AHB10022.1 arabinose efflux permease family protein [Zymomonas mobilis subsp. mobilis str. CP4 = NRRL B-14023]AHJ70328.1 Inner membrane transport protein ynfM [Zymomonas mobilis subsp. mobilis NRRL B-12526]AHJ72183.1 Inner membrane transport protein ynfM [Zymomonas mobilis subsp. mobilis str. CP4 = NRRL B-14023]MCP9307243.1 MFS transporter [Zymomonas mobilis]TWE25803.1 YNFM family putative membrane transporter [Zymomonas mobilis]